MQRIKNNLIPFFICIISILLLATVVYPFIFSQFTIINESIAIPDFSTEGIKLIDDDSIQRNIIIQLLGGYKILEGFFFHHHMTVLLPVYYLDIGLDKNIHQYGILTSYYILFTSIIFFKEISINSYMSIIHSFLIIFPISLTYIGFKIYTNKYLVAVFILIFTLSYVLLDFTNFYLTPTVSPIRQAFIPFIFYFIYKIFVDNQSKYYLALYIFLFLQSFVFIELSIFLITSTLVLTTIKNNVEIKNKVKYGNLIIFLIIILIFIFNNFNSDNYFSSFNFIFLGPVINLFDLCVITILLTSLMYIVGSSVSESKYHLFIKIISGYSIFSLLYFVWNPAYNHLGPIFWPFSFIILFFIDKFIIKKTFSTTIIILFLMTIFITTFAIKNFYTEKNLFYTPLTTNLEVYDMNINKKINMKTTMNPEFIIDSCKIMDKYEKGLSVNMISIHDSFLPFFCNKANNKYDQLIINMVNDKIKEKAYIYFRDKKLIFVDNFIDDENSKIYYREYFNALDFRIKMFAIGQARDMFKKIKKEGKYKLVEKGKLISVYMKID